MTARCRTAGRQGDDSAIPSGCRRAGCELLSLVGAGHMSSISLEILPLVTRYTVRAVISVGMSPKWKPESCSSSTTKSPAVMRLATVTPRSGLSANSAGVGCRAAAGSAQTWSFCAAVYSRAHAWR
jgi:hypothetical protein